VSKVRDTDICGVVCCGQVNIPAFRWLAPVEEKICFLGFNSIPLNCIHIPKEVTLVGYSDGKPQLDLPPPKKTTERWPIPVEAEWIGRKVGKKKFLFINVDFKMPVYISVKYLYISYIYV